MVEGRGSKGPCHKNKCHKVLLTRLKFYGFSKNFSKSYWSQEGENGARRNPVNKFYRMTVSFLLSLLVIIKTIKKIIICPKLKRKRGGLKAGLNSQVHTSQSAKGGWGSRYSS